MDSVDICNLYIQFSNLAGSLGNRITQILLDLIGWNSWYQIA